MAIIIDIDDLSKTLRIPSKELMDKTSVLQSKLDLNAEKIHESTGVKYILILEAKDDLSVMPELMSLELDETIETLQQPERNFYSHLLDTSTKVKQEPFGIDDKAHRFTDWSHAYNTFFKIIADTKSSRTQHVTNVLNMLGVEPESALPKIEALIEIAARYDSLALITASLEGVIMKHIRDDTLYHAISIDPSS